MMRSLAVTLAFLLPLAVRADAQLPRFTVDLTAGRGEHTMQAGAVYYRQAFDEHLRAAASLRLLRNERLAPVVIVERSGVLASGQLADCPVTPNGSCARYFPEGGGTGVGVGVRFAPVRRVAIGAGYVRIMGEHDWNALDAEVALSLWRHFGLVGTARHLSSRNREGDRIWIRPLSVGIRLQ